MIAFFMASICAMVVKYFTVDDFSSLLDFEKLVVVSSEKLDDNYVKNGEDFYIVLPSNEGRSVLENWENINAKGVNLYFKEKTLNYFMERVENLQKIDDINGQSCWQGYYGGFKDFRYINKKKINFQLVQTEECWIMGFPYILTGF